MTRGQVAVVVGAGRSGTSALTRGVQAVGVDLGNKLKAATQKNARGFFEDVDLLDVNHRLHKAFGLKSSGSSLRLIDEQEWQAINLQPFEQEVVKIIERRFSDMPLWGFKSGGILRLLPFWERIFERLNLDVCYVVAIRNPLSVARSRMKLNALRGLQEHSDLEWLVRVAPYFHFVMRRRFVVVDYDNLMNDPEGQLTRIARALRNAVDEKTRGTIKDYVDHFLSEGLRHNRVDMQSIDRDPKLNPLTREAYQWLHRFSLDALDPRDEKFQQRWQAIVQSLQQMAPVLRHLDYLDTRIRGPRWGTSGALRTLMQHLPRRSAR